jgi:hypothetical protein
MRRPRIKAQGLGSYHCISRSVEGRLIFPNLGAGFDLQTVQRVVEQEEGQLSVTESLRCRIRYFSAGAILGSKAFIEQNFERWKERFKFKRPRGPYRVDRFHSFELWAFHHPRIQQSG